ncbi:DNA polymerase I [Blastopirellula marina]|uniref:DNA polymerase I n=2 Tax=Blastopirellula marina TaxID=124 RepID=A0A2S8FDJ5_9BACT|nr:DNA polymerase I [Blastopirellula marina]PTL42463.1 DNA polymerase I [Blastopirellula marina]
MNTPEEISEKVSAATPQPAEKTDPNDLRGKNVWIVDSHSLIFQVFHAIKPMTGPAGQPVAAIYGFARDMIYLLEKKKPDYLICAFDMHGPTFRHELYDDYKVNRSEMPEDLPSQIEGIRRLLDAMNIPVIESPGFEADDVLAAVAKVVDEQGGSCTLVTTDKDCRQLITDNVRLFNVRKDAFYDAESLLEDWGIRPDQVVDFQAMVGDQVDNVPGIPLIGPKIAKELLNQFGTLEEVLNNVDKISGKKRKENLANGREKAMLSKDLVRLRDDVPIEWDWAQYLVGPTDAKACEAICDEYGFRTLPKQLQALSASEAGEVNAPVSQLQQDQLDYQTINTLDELRELVTVLAAQTRISIDTETTHTSPRWADLVGISVAWKPGVARYIPIQSPEEDVQLPLDEAIEILRPVLEDPNVKKLGQNLKYDEIVFRGVGVQLAGVDFDTMIAHYLLEAGARSHGLDELARRYLQHETVKISELIGTGKKQILMSQVPLEKVSYYACEDADIPLRLFEILNERLDEEGLNDLFDDVEIPLIDVLVEMEYNGIRVDTDRLTQLSGDYGQRLEELETQIYEIAGQPFNIASPKQLAEILFEKRGLPIIKKTKTGASTDAEVLEQLAKQDPLPQKIVEYRQYAKLKNTYIDALPNMICPKTNLVHTSFNQVVAATGRLSSNEPNLQNIPIRTKEGKDIRSAFKASREDWVLVCADYSQIELRVLAHYSKDQALRDAYQQNQDIHARVASEVYGIPLAEVSSSERRSAKAINFGIVYGQSAFGLAKALDIEKDKAFGFIDAYFRKYPGVDDFMENTLQQCYKDGFVKTYLGRRRKIDGVRSPQKRDRMARQLLMPERTAVNTVIQGSAADIIKLAMLRVHQALMTADLEARLLLQIHDELVFEAPPEEVPELVRLISHEMVHAVELDVPLVVDVESGLNWAECEPVEIDS